MSNEKDNDNTKRYLKKLHGRIKICMFVYDCLCSIQTKGEIGPKKNPFCFHATVMTHKHLLNGEIEEIGGHMLSLTGLRVR